MKNLSVCVVATVILFMTLCCSVQAQGHVHDSNEPRHIEEVDNDLKCYSCVYIQSKANLTNEGCEKDKPPANYKRTDCFGFGNLQAAGAIRHSNGSHVAHAGDQPKNVHCVKISGFTDSGILIVMRGCEHLLETNDTIHNEQCFKNRDYDFVFPGEGFVRNVEKCYCHGQGCNGSSNLISFLSLSLLLPLITSYTLGSKF